MYDRIFEGGLVVDGSGAPRRRADVAIRDGRIAAIGLDLGEARERIDATGRIVAPGFIDVHTHYDGQVFWDPYLSPSPLHGVTTVVAGHCGFSIAPTGPEHADYAMKLLARVEEIPLETLRQGVDWGSWGSFGSFLDRLEGAPAINIGFMAGHCAIRRVAMGEAAVGSQATPAQIAAMQGLLREALDAGALGFSSSAGRLDHDHNGQPTPSRWASDEEIFALASVVRDYPGTTIEWLPTELTADTEPERIRKIAEVSGRPVIWNLFFVAEQYRANIPGNLRLAEEIAAAGGKLVGTFLPMPMTLHVTFSVACLLEALPGWEAIRYAQPREERLRAMRDPEVRRRLKDGAASELIGPEVSDFADYVVEYVALETNAALRGRRVGDVAAERGQEPLDALLEIALADELGTVFRPRALGGDPALWPLRADIWRHPGALIGGTDAGAHLTLIDTFNLYSDFVGRSVRERRLVELEEAVRLVTDAPARFLGLRDRGQVAVGGHADLVVFDPETLAPEPPHLRADLPGGASRLYGGAVGMEHVFVAGAEIVRHGEFTGARAGTVLRGGRDTQ